MKKKLLKILLIFLGAVLLIMLALASVEDDPFEKGNSLLAEKKFKEAIASFEKIDSKHPQFANKDSLITKVKEEAKKYYTDMINSEIENLNYEKCIEYLNLCKEITGIEIAKSDDISKKISANIILSKNNIKKYENAKNYYGIVKEAEKLLNVSAEKSYAESLISKYQELAKKEEISSLKKEINNLISYKKYQEAKEVLNKLEKKYSTDEKEYISKMKDEINDLIKNPRFNIGEKFQTDNMEICVLSVKTFRVIGDPDFGGSEAPEGGIFVGVIYSVKNITKEPLNELASLIDIKLVNSAKTKFEENYNATLSYRVETGIEDRFLEQLNPGLTVKNVAVFEISQDMWREPGWYLLIEGKKVIIK